MQVLELPDSSWAVQLLLLFPLILPLAPLVGALAVAVPVSFGGVAPVGAPSLQLPGSESI